MDECARESIGSLISYRGEPSVERAEEFLHHKRVDVREKGMRMLIDLAAWDQVLEHSLKEHHGRVLDLACGALFPEPVELLKHLVTVEKGPNANLEMAYHVPESNYVYAQHAIADVYRRRKNRLHPDVIEAIGLARLTALCPFLPRYLDARLMAVSDARRKLGPKAVAGIDVFVSSDGSDTWCRPSACAIHSAIALRRADQPVEVEQVERMLAEITTAMSSDCYTARWTHAALKWVQFDAGVLDDLAEVLSLVGSVPEVVGDFVTTFLKRGEQSTAARIAAAVPSVYLVCRGFCYWPLADFLNSQGILDVSRYGRHRTQAYYGYRRARLMGIEPPAWWSWI
jgi:hypothetical protein